MKATVITHRTLPPVAGVVVSTFAWCAAATGSAAEPAPDPTWLQSATESGIRPFASYTGEYFGNLDGGLARGGVREGLLDFGVGIDLEKLAGVTGGSLFFAGHWIEGEDPSAELTGDFNAVSNLAAFDTVRLFQAWYGQSLGERWTWRAGLLAADEDFTVSEAAQLYLNGAFGPIPTLSGNVGAPVWPLGAPGVLLEWEDPGGGFLRLGVYDGDAGDEAVNDDGLHVSLSSRQGALSILEGGVATSRLGHPGVYKLGAFHHSGELRDFATGGTADGTHGLYFVADQTVWRGGESRLVCFWRAGWNPPEDRSVVGYYGDFGLNLEGLPGRPADSVGVAFSHTGFADAYVAARRTGGENVSRRESVLELSYRAAITPRWSLQPDLQWVIDPHESRRDALIAGLRTRISF